MPDQPVVPVKVGFGVDTKWMDKVTDGEYRGARR
jgi:hypothetical protein